MTPTGLSKTSKTHSNYKHQQKGIPPRKNSSIRCGVTSMISKVLSEDQRIGTGKVTLEILLSILRVLGYEYKIVARKVA